jgi:hypothetical protein
VLAFLVWRGRFPHLAVRAFIKEALLFSGLFFSGFGLITGISVRAPPFCARELGILGGCL